MAGRRRAWVFLRKREETPYQSHSRGTRRDSCSRDAPAERLDVRQPLGFLRLLDRNVTPMGGFALFHLENLLLSIEQRQPIGGSRNEGREGDLSLGIGLGT